MKLLYYSKKKLYFIIVHNDRYEVVNRDIALESSTGINQKTYHIVAVFYKQKYIKMLAKAKELCKELNNNK